MLSIQCIVSQSFLYHSCAHDNPSIHCIELPTDEFDCVYKIIAHLSICAHESPTTVDIQKSTVFFSFRYPCSLLPIDWIEFSFFSGIYCIVIGSLADPVIIWTIKSSIKKPSTRSMLHRKLRIRSHLKRIFFSSVFLHMARARIVLWFGKLTLNLLTQVNGRSSFRSIYLSSVFVLGTALCKRISILYTLLVIVVSLLLLWPALCRSCFLFLFIVSFCLVFVLSFTHEGGLFSLLFSTINGLLFSSAVFFRSFFTVSVVCDLCIWNYSISFLMYRC